MNCKKMMTSLTAAALCVSLAACGSTGAASGAAASSESTAAESAVPLRLHRQNLLLKLPAAEK